MIDQTRVQSGFDVEVMLGSRYLQYLLLLAADIGMIPASLEVHGQTVRLMEPKTADRTYDPDPDAEPLVPSNVDTPLTVDVLPPGHPSGADVKVTLFVEAGFPNVDMGLYFNLSLDTAPADDGGLGVVTLGTELVDVDGTLVNFVHGLTPPIEKDELIAQLSPFVNRSLDLGGTGGGGRLERLALRRHAGDADHDAALGLYLNLRLRNGPHEGDFAGPRGDVASSLNFLPTGSDIAFATRATLYGALGPDARFRRAEPDGSGFSYPVYRHPSKHEDLIGQLLEVKVRPPDSADSTITPPDPTAPRVPGGVQPPPPPAPGGYLTTVIHGDYSIDWLPDPDYRLYVYLFGQTDDEGVMSWGSDSDFEAGILADIVFGIISLALIPLLGPWSLAVFTALEVAKYGTDKIISAELIDDKVQARVDAGLMDVAPNRFTVVRRRWDPFFETHHQVGLRPGEVDVNELGMVITGPAVLTRQPHVVKGSLIREAVRDDTGALVGLGYRVADADAYLALADVVAPATDRGVLLPPGSTVDPDLVALGIDEAVARVQAEQLEPAIHLHVVRVEMDGSTVTGLLLLTVRELGWLREDLVAAHTDAARARITADQEATIRDAVVQELEDQGVIATPEEVDAEVAARIEALVVQDEADYEAGPLADDLAAAVDAAATLVLSPDEAGHLQDQGVLVLDDYVAVHVSASDRWYYRDRYVRAEEPTVPKRLADNLDHKPRFRRTPAGLTLV
jgi:hypothetical protein